MELFSHETAVFYSWQCTNPLLFHNFDIPQSTHSQALNNYDFILDTIFFICMHAHLICTLLKIAELENSGPAIWAYNSSVARLKNKMFSMQRVPLFSIDSQI